MISTSRNTVVHGDCMKALGMIDSGTISLVYIDPPFNTGNVQELHGLSYADKYDDYIGYMSTVFIELKRVLSPVGQLFVHVDPREVHYLKVCLDGIFGRQNFINEIIWSFDYGGRPKNRWPAKHNNILWYVRNSKKYVFNFDEIDRIPYMAPGLVGAEKAARGKTPTDVWWNTIVPTNGSERVDYPTQKPLSILNRIVTVHSNVGDTVLDCFSGSGTTACAAATFDRKFIAVDSSVDAVELMCDRLSFAKPKLITLR